MRISREDVKRPCVVQPLLRITRPITVNGSDVRTAIIGVGKFVQIRDKVQKHESKL